jgi:transposase
MALHPFLKSRCATSWSAHRSSTWTRPACARRGSPLANVVDIVVHDHWKPYYTMSGVLCNAHDLRELKALINIEKEE